MKDGLKASVSGTVLFASCLAAIRTGDLTQARAILADLNGQSLGSAADQLHEKLLAIIAERGSRDANGNGITPMDSGEPVWPVMPRQAAPRQQGQPKVSLVAACMNRQHNLMKVLPTWLATSADEILIVDWSSSEEVWPLVSHIDDPRLKVIRIDGEPHWILTHALNVGFRHAAHELIFKVDCDIRVSPDFIERNMIRPGEFIRGFWKQAVDAGKPDQRYVNGTFAAFKTDLEAIGCYDERITSYGWDDSDLYKRLSMNAGLAGRLLDADSAWHIEQQEAQRTENQQVQRGLFLGRYGPTEFEGAKNKYYTEAIGAWASYFMPQGYELVAIGPRYRRGLRSTPLYPVATDYVRLAEVMAARQLTIWAGELNGQLDFEGKAEYSRLMRDAHRDGRTEAFSAALRNGCGMSLVQVPAGPLRDAMMHTLRVIDAREQAEGRAILVVEADAPLQEATSIAGLEGALSASREAIDALANSGKAVLTESVDALEGLMSPGCANVLLRLSAESFCEDVLKNANEFVARLGSRFESTAEPVADTCLITSLYDESNLIRLREYLCCVVLNLRIFERVILAYERRNGLLEGLVSLLAERLQVSMGRLLLTPYNKRPTFEELFSAQSIVSTGTVFAVANADIVFDASFRRLGDLDLISNIVVLSRWDVSDDGHTANLIRLDNGSPNIFSADAWIVRTPFVADFYLDYGIGTFHCDSFINHQISRSTRYGAFNPCFDVRVFHLHDERFNSSREKHERDKAEIEAAWGRESARNGGGDPVRGLAWGASNSYVLAGPEVRFQCWRPKMLVLDLAQARSSFGHLLILHALRPIMERISDTVLLVRLREEDGRGCLGRLLERYRAHFQVAGMQLELDDCRFDDEFARQHQVITRELEFGDLMGLIQPLAPGPFDEVIWRALDFADQKGMLRVHIGGGCDDSKVTALIERLAMNSSDLLLRSLREFVLNLPVYSPEWRMCRIYLGDLAPLEKWATRDADPVAEPRVSFVTSLFRGRDLLPGFLDNLLLAVRVAQGEAIIVDANSDDVDAGIVSNYFARRPDAQQFIRYIRLTEDPGLYNCWRIGIENARAPFVTNANLDDKRSPFHTARLLGHLESHPAHAGACGSIACVRTAPELDWFCLADTEVWFHGEGSREIGFDDLYLKDQDGPVRSRNVMHCMPVWRKSLHDQYGYFDEETYGTSADWAFWLHCSKAGEKFYFLEDVFGRYYLNLESHNRRNDKEGVKELRILAEYLGVVQCEIEKQ